MMLTFYSFIGLFRQFQGIHSEIIYNNSHFMPVDKIKPAEIDAWLSRVTKTRATSNRYLALFSLVFREA